MFGNLNAKYFQAQFQIFMTPTQLPLSMIITWESATTFLCPFFKAKLSKDYPFFTSFNQLDGSFKMSNRRNRLDEVLNEIKEDLLYTFFSAKTCTAVNCFSCNNLQSPPPPSKLDCCLQIFSLHYILFLELNWVVWVPPPRTAVPQPLPGHVHDHHHLLALL